MAASSSIAQEFFKVRNEWEQADKLQSWKLAVWVLEYQDLDIVDKFIETERTILGVFDDIFFRFDSSFKDSNEAFEKELWKEFEEWFLLPQNKKQDMYTALKNDGLLVQDFIPNTSLPQTAENLFKEIIRFKNCVKEVEKRNFCIYFPPTSADYSSVQPWLNKILKDDTIPNGIRLVTIDFTARRRIKIDRKVLSGLVIELHPKLNMLAAINNEMDKAGGTYNTTSVDAQFRKQIRLVMEETIKKIGANMDKEVNTLISLSKQMKTVSANISGLLVAAQAYFAINATEKSEAYADQAIKKALVLMEKNDPSGYPTWKACTMLKAAILVGKKKRKEAIVQYENLAKTATSQGDAFTIMEGYRLSGHMYYELKKLPEGFENLLLAMVAGSYMEMRERKQSTFLHAAYLALHIAKEIKTKVEINVLENQLQEWLGEDWNELLKDEGVVKAKVKRKTSVFG